MPADLFRRIDLDLLYPPFRDLMFEVIAACRAKGSFYVAQYGFRSWPQQHQLRLAWLNKQGGRAAPAGYSAHQYGLAIDFVADQFPDTPGLQPDWTDAAYDCLGREAQGAGLIWGVGFGDRPHVQWPGYVSGTELQPLLDIWKTSVGTDLARLGKVWQHVSITHP